MQQIQSRDNNYDLLRVIAALCILFTHSYDLLDKNAIEPLMVLSNQKINFAHIGLYIFFAVSGYLIAKSAETSSSFKNYIWKRFLRIQPLLIIVSLISIFIIGPIFTTTTIKAYFADYNTYTYIRNVMPLFGIQFTLPNVFTNNIGDVGVNGSMWTLVVEERLYLIIGILFLQKVYFKKVLVVGILILNILFFLNSTFYKDQLIPYLNRYDIFYVIIFLNGSLFHFLQIPFALLKYKGLVSSFIFAILYFTSFTIIENSIKILLIPFLVIVLAEIKGFTNNAAKYGDITYGLYIFSFPLQQMLIASNLCTNPSSLLLSTLLFVGPMAFLSWHIIEKKMLSYKEKFE